jgi:hypothetical protein
MLGSFLPFLAMNRPQQEEAPPPVMPLPANNQSLDQNLIAQLEAAQYGQSMTPPPMPMPEVAPAQVPTQPQLNRRAQESGGLPPMPGEAPLSVREELMKASQQQMDLQNQAIKQAEEQLAAARSTPQKMDLSPLIALSQSWSQRPSNLLQAYQRPTDQSKNIQALQDAVLKARGGAASLAVERATNVGKLEQMEFDRKQRLKEIALKQKELGIAKEDRSYERQEKKILALREGYNKNFGNTISGLSEVMNAAERIKAIINEAGGIPTDPRDPRRQEYISAVSQMTTGFNRDVAKLGALAGADLELLNAVTANNTSLVDAYFKNMFGRGAVQGTISVLDGIMQRGDSTMDEYQQRVKDTYLGYADEPFKNQKSLYKKAREQGRQRKAIQFGPSEDEETTEPTEQLAKKYTRDELVNLKNTNPEEFEREFERVVGRR